MTSDNKCIIGFFQLKNENPILSKPESQKINMSEHPTHQVNVSRKRFCVRRSLANFIDSLYKKRPMCLCLRWTFK